MLARVEVTPARLLVAAWLLGPFFLIVGLGGALSKGSAGPALSGLAAACACVLTRWYALRWSDRAFLGLRESEAKALVALRLRKPDPRTAAQPTDAQRTVDYIEGLAGSRGIDPDGVRRAEQMLRQYDEEQL